VSYTVLARKFRSRTFDEVVGQSAITTTLRNAIEQNRVHHGYLFTGTRGVGKTSMARILAKALNCLKSDGPTITPCGECDSCVSIARGEDVDVVEIDAASNNGVDNIRELRSNAVYRPARSRFKIYIIDEVHMLSAGAFNALLKTLEEPPSHVKFILATTESQKVPATIRSRVQQFQFNAISPADIAVQLKSICSSENVTAEESALKRLARLANGSMRDALSLLDQAISMCGGQLTEKVVNELFPAAHDEVFAELIDYLGDNNAAGALTIVDQSLARGQALDHWCSMLIGQLRDLMIIRICGADTDLADVPAALRPRLEAQAEKFDAGAFTYMITVLEELRRNVRSSGSGRALVEAAIVRLAEVSRFSSIETLMQHIDAGIGAAPAPPSSRAAQSGTPQAKPPMRDQSARESLLAPPSVSGTVSSPLPAPFPAPTQSPAPARRASPPPSQSTAPIPGRRMTQADIKAAHADPTVKTVLEMFGGHIADVQRGPQAAEE
jgi:DNA polymerase-3 subunit gamma/tau